MPLGDSRYFSREHIERQRFGTSPLLAEQAVHSLELVAELAATGLSFQFKGGSSLLLILDTPRRFSIDVDIATGETRERIEESVAAIVERYQTFTRWEPRPHKTKPWLPISSYYLFFNSRFDGSGESSIMLDVQLRRSPYKTGFHPVECGDLYRCPQQVELPLAASIAGDKLLTMGPATLGIPLGKNKQAQRLKHVYDVSSLMETMPALEDIRESFFATLEHENSLQEKHVTAREVMDDTIAFCATVTRHAERPTDFDSLDPVLRENAEGLPDFAGHLFADAYTWTDLQRDMARVAYCIAAVCTPTVSPDSFRETLSASTGHPPPIRELPEGITGNPVAKYFWAHAWGIVDR